MAHTSVNGLPIASGIELVPTRHLPDRFRSIFPFDFFNAMQSKCFSSIYDHTDNFVLSAPTGSGKTAILELAICNFLIHASVADASKGKIIYLPPTKALCSERQRDWAKKFSSIGLKCHELTGDTETSQLRGVQSANIIITTPEKWDSVTRRCEDHGKLKQLVRLFLIDEVHTLKDDRGACLEAVVSRMKSAQAAIRFIALSATVPNSDDIAIWLGKSCDALGTPALRQVFGEHFRPVKLQKHVIGLVSNASSDWQLEKVCDQKLPEIISRFSERKPIIIFCFTRNSTKSTAQSLANWWQSSEQRQWNVPQRTPLVSDPALNDCLQAGVAFHHAGVDLNDRKNIEKAYLEGHLSVLCCTSTLSVGINLPCHLVIIKNTVTYQTESGSCKEYADIDIMQMLGRAGRPQFDRSATAVILTRPEKRQHYEKVIQGQELLESKLHLNLIEHLNAEICLGTVHSVDSASAWLQSTFLATRLSKNPQHYRIEGDSPPESLQTRASRICSRDVERLLRYDLVDDREGLLSTEYGRIMARYYVSFDTMKLVMGLQEKAKMSEILSAIAQSAELKNMRFKGGEKPMYKDINGSHMLKFPIKVHLDLPAHKVSLIIQAALSGLDMTHDARYSSHQRQHFLDTSTVLKHAKRLVRCIVDCKVEARDAIAARNALELARSLAAQAWDDSPHQLSQLEGIGPVAVRKFVADQITTIDDLECTEPLKIDRILSKNPPFGANLLTKLRGLPKLRVSLKMAGKPVRTFSGNVEIKLEADVGFLNDRTPAAWKKTPIHVHFLAETSDGLLIHFARASASGIGGGKAIGFTAEFHNASQIITCHVACDDIAGTLQFATLDPKIPATMFDIRAPARSFDCVTRKAARARSHSKRRLKEDFGDEFGDCEIDDTDLVATAVSQGTEYVACIDDFSSEDEKDGRNLSDGRQHSDAHKTPNGSMEPNEEENRNEVEGPSDKKNVAEQEAQAKQYNSQELQDPDEPLAKRQKIERSPSLNADKAKDDERIAWLLEEFGDCVEFV